MYFFHHICKKIKIIKIINIRFYSTLNRTKEEDIIINNKTISSNITKFEMSESVKDEMQKVLSSNLYKNDIKLTCATQSLIMLYNKLQPYNKKVTRNDVV